MKRKCSRPCIAKMNFIKHFIIVTPFLKSLHEKKKRNYNQYGNNKNN